MQGVVHAFALIDRPEPAGVDPVCGRRLSAEMALLLVEEEATRHFCSSACRRAYLVARRKGSIPAPPRAREN